MKVAVFSTKSYDRQSLEVANSNHDHELIFLEPRLTRQTASLALDCTAICAFVHDELTAPVLAQLAQQGTKLIALRCAGFNNVDLEAAAQLGLTVLRVPAYSPYAVAEHTVALILALNRKIHRAFNRVREGNFSLEGLLGFDLNGRTVGLVGTGKIGQIVGHILQGFGCRILAYDLYPNQAFADTGVQYVEPHQLAAESDIIALHCPLTPETYHIVNAETIQLMKMGVMLINTSRGALIDARAVIEGLKSKKIGYLALDVYEQESDLFFEDLSNEVIQDDVFQRLLTFPNVIITGHQGFFTQDALQNIAETTIANLTDFQAGKSSPNQVSASNT